MTKLLIIEDEEKLARFVELELLHEGYAVEKASDGRTGLQLAEAGRFDLILLDIMLPELNGMEVLRRLRRTSTVPVILLTARDAVMDKVTGLDTGADDYITKPFSIEELLARIRSALRKQKQFTADTTYSCGPVVLDTARHAVTCNGAPVELTAREFTLLQYFMVNKSIALSRETLLEHVWGYDYIGETNVVDVYVRYLRQKIDETCGCKIIHTVRGIGYALRDPEDP